VIVPIVERLLRQQIEVILVDNWSTDGTVDAVRSALGETAVRVERFPVAAPDGTWEWSSQLSFAETLLRAQPGGWAINHDADEIHESPWPHTDLRAALWNVEHRGYNAVDHTVVDFRLVDDHCIAEEDLAEAYDWFEFVKHPAHLIQVKAWRNDGETVGLAATGGHSAAAFPGARIFPYKFLLRHYSIRSADCGTHKIVGERKDRVARHEHAHGWRAHYDVFSGDASFGWRTEDLHRFDPDDFPSEFLVERLTGVGILRDPDGLSA
jgi:hypothetical protein